jgi:hypothetical protein
MSNRNANLIQCRRKVLKTLASPLYNSSASGNPSIPQHAVGDYILAIGVAPTSATIPTLTGFGSPLLAEAVGPQSYAVYGMVASSADHTIAWTGVGGASIRAVWVFPGGAQLDTLNASNGTSAALVFETQPTMTPDSLLGAYVLTNTAQTNIATPLAATITAGVAQRAIRNAVPANWVGDTNTGRLSAFGGAGLNGTFDTAPSRWSAIVFSMKAPA